jgi:hypothetical protein
MGKKSGISRRILAARINPPHGSTWEAIQLLKGRDRTGGSRPAPTTFVEKVRYD